MTHSRKAARCFPLAILSAFSAVLALGFLLLRWPFQIPSAFSIRLWFVHILQPIVSVTAGSPNIAHAVFMSTAWWPFALGIALLLIVLAAATRKDRSARRMISLGALTLALIAATATEIVFARSRSLFEYGSLVWAVILNVGIGGGLIGLALGITERSSGMSHRMVRLVRVLLIAAGIGFASFVLLPLASIPFVLSLLVLSYGYAMQAFRSRSATAEPAAQKGLSG